MTDGSAPLAGIVVVSVEQAIAAPFASRQLADLGATVIKVESPTGDLARHYDSVMGGQSANFVWVNRGKQSISLDLRAERDRATLHSLIAGADVFIHNVAPATARRLGLTASELVERHPALIACEISGYGTGGPREDDKAYDLAIQAEVGAFSVTGGEEMSKVGFSAADIAAAMYALASILAALVRRGRTGEGAAICVSMLDVMTEWMSAPLYGAVYGAGQPTRTGRRHHSIAPYGTFAIADGRSVLIAVQTDAEWVRFADQVLGDPALAGDPRFFTNPDRMTNVDELERIIRTAFLDVDAALLLARLTESRIVCASVNNLVDVWSHEQLRVRDKFTVASTESGEVEVLAAPFAISGWRTPSGAVPALDEHDVDAVQSIIERGEDREEPHRVV